MVFINKERNKKCKTLKKKIILNRNFCTHHFKIITIKTKLLLYLSHHSKSAKYLNWYICEYNLVNAKVIKKINKTI